MEAITLDNEEAIATSPDLSSLMSLLPTKFKAIWLQIMHIIQHKRETLLPQTLMIWEVLQLQGFYNTPKIPQQ